ncbi:MAG: ATP-binding protein [Gemmatimonadota bacterium]
MTRLDSLPRAAGRKFDTLLGIFPVVVATGARQTGKSTLVTGHPAMAGRPVFSLDSAATRADAARDPEGFVAQSPTMIIDEVQRVPELMLAIKRAVDMEGQATKGRFVLTGSANLLMMKQVADSLAGRAAYLRLGPMTRREQLGFGETGRWSSLLSEHPDRWRDVLAEDVAPPEDWRDLSVRGGFPPPALHLPDDARAFWFEDYVSTYVERDLRDLSAVELLGDFQRTMRALALRAGNPLNQNEIARDLGVPQRNISRWIGLMETSWLLTQLPAYTVNRTSRLKKRPKIYWADAGLSLHLSGEHDPRGVHLETLVLSDLHAWAALETRRPEILYWRTADNAEVDFIIETARTLLAVEVKSATKVSLSDAANLKRFVAEYGDACHGAILLYDGTDIVRLADRVMAVPWWQVV